MCKSSFLHGVNTADPTQLSGYVDKKGSFLIFPKGTERKKFPLLIFVRDFCLDQSLAQKLVIRIFILLTTQEKKQTKYRVS